MPIRAYDWGPRTKQCAHGIDALVADRRGQTYCPLCKRDRQMHGKAAPAPTQAPPWESGAAFVPDLGAHEPWGTSTYDRWQARRPEPDPTPPPTLSPLFGTGLELPDWGRRA